MTNSTIKAEIEKTATELNISVIELISQMQGECAKRKDEKAIMQLHNLKMTYVNSDLK